MQQMPLTNDDNKPKFEIGLYSYLSLTCFTSENQRLQRSVSPELDVKVTGM